MHKNAHIAYIKVSHNLAVGRGAMGCFFKYILWGVMALCIGVMSALLFPIRLIAGIEALVIIVLGICFCFKK